MSRPPFFSVLLPVYNGAQVVGAAIESVRAQTDSDWEIVAVDDGSTDGSFEVLRAAARRDPRVRVHRIPNSGSPARPRNRAMAEAAGQALCLLDQDDQWLPDKLAVQRPLLATPGTGIVFGDAWYERNGVRELYSQMWGRPHRGRVADRLIEANFIPALTAVVPADVARAVGGLDERLVGVDEYHWWLRIAMSGYSVDYVAEPVGVYRVGDSNLSHDHARYLLSMDACLSDLSGKYPQWSEALGARRHELRRRAFDFHAARLAEHGLVGPDARADLLRAARLVRGWPDAKRVLASALPPRLRAKLRSSE